MIKAVLDANVFVSAMLIQQGFPARILDRWRNDAFILLTSVPILEEIRRVLNYPRLVKRHKKSSQDIEKYIENLAHSTLIVLDPPPLNVIKEDPTDNRYIECAVAAGANYIVSGDDHLLDIGAYQDILIITPRKFWDALQK